MSHVFSLAHLTVLELPPIELLHVAEAAGYDYFSPRLVAVTAGEQPHPLVGNREKLRELKRALRQSRVRVHDVELASLKPDVEPAAFQAMFETAAELQAHFVITQLPDPDRNRSLDKFVELCELAAPYSLRPMLEFTSWSPTPDFAEAKTMLEKAGQDNAGILVDLLHVSRSHTDPADFTSVPPSWFGFVHLCDAIGPPPPDEEAQLFTARHDRVPPGMGDIDVDEVLLHLPPVPYSLEIPNTKRKQAMGAKAYAAWCIDETKKYFSRHAGLFPATDKDKTAGQAPAVSS